MNKRSTFIMVTDNGMGHADEVLKLKLIESYFRLLLESPDLPDAIGFYAEGVKLVTTGSPILEHLKELYNHGVLLIICSTCLDHYNLMNHVKIGLVSHMPDIIGMQQKADKVITL